MTHEQSDVEGKRCEPGCDHEWRAVVPLKHPNGMEIAGAPPQREDEPAWCRKCGALRCKMIEGLGWGVLYPMSNQQAPTVGNILRHAIGETEPSKPSEKTELHTKTLQVFIDYWRARTRKAEAALKVFEDRLVWGWAVYDADTAEGIDGVFSTRGRAEAHRDETYEAGCREDVEIFPLMIQDDGEEVRGITLSEEQLQALGVCQRLVDREARHDERAREREQQ